MHLISRPANDPSVFTITEKAPTYYIRQKRMSKYFALLGSTAGAGQVAGGGWRGMIGEKITLCKSELSK